MPKDKMAGTVQRNLGVLCNLNAKRRLELIAEGMPILLGSARSFCGAAEALADNPREAAVLSGFAVEEAAKILILIDIMRCPKRIISARIGPMVGWFYDHLARLLYAEAQRWKPTTITELQAYLDNERRSHYVDGFAGEYIMANSAVFNREAAMYADVLRYEDSEPSWNDPVSTTRFWSIEPPALRVVEALDALGLLTIEGLAILAEVWNAIEFKESETHSGWDGLIIQTIQRAFKANTLREDAEQKHVDWLRGGWQAPMYHLDFKRLDVPLDQLQREQEAAMWSEIGYDGP